MIRNLASLRFAAPLLMVGLLGSPALPEQAGHASKLSENVSVSYVIVPFAAWDRRGKPIDDLRPADVRLFVDGVAVATDMFERVDDAAVSFTILLDTSGSMALAGKLDGARQAIAALIANRKPEDDYALYTFAAGHVVECVPFTRDGGLILDAANAIEPWGKTALFDAIARMPDKSILGQNGSRAIILLTDGLDNASSLSREQLATILEGVDVPVYPLGLRPSHVADNLEIAHPREALLDLHVLADLAGRSGGRMAIATDPGELKTIIGTVLDEVRAQFLLGFTPSGRGGVRYRRISLAIAGPVRTIRVRGGYRGTEPPPLRESRKKGSDDEGR